MKYVRTIDDKIIEIDEKGCIKEFNNKLYAFRDKTFSYRFENGREVVKQSDTIDELCDEFVVWDDLNKKCIDIYSNSTEIYEDKWYEMCEVFGAIYTNKGLIYVAKFNDEGVLQIL